MDTVFIRNDAPVNRTLLLSKSHDLINWSDVGTMPGKTSLLLLRTNHSYFRALLLPDTNQFSLLVTPSNVSTNNGIIGGHGGPALPPPVVNLVWLYVDYDNGVIYYWDTEFMTWD